MKLDVPKLTARVRDLFQKKKPVEAYKPDITNYERDFHKLTFEELSQRLNTSVTTGLDESQAKELLTRNGKNRITQKKKNPIFKIIGYFFSGFCPLIFIAAIVCILAWQPIGSINGSQPQVINLALGIMLIIVIFIQAGFTAFQDWSSNKVMKSIKNMMPTETIVIRNRMETKIHVEELVIGDLVALTYGNKVPADLRLVETHDLKFDKSMLTGESEAIEGTVECTDERYVESKNIAYMTTLITNGTGKGIVIETGDRTMMGSIAGLTSGTTAKQTTLQNELNRFIIFIALLSLLMGTIVVIVWATWLRTSHPGYLDVSSMLVNVISVMIAFIPEGLPVCVTLSLLLIARRMAKYKVLVKELSTIETLSCVNVIASDKTGTLTQNKMFVASASAGLARLDLNALKQADTRCIGFEQLVASCFLCNNASFDLLDTQPDVNIRKAKGDATDISLLRFSTTYQKLPHLDQFYELLTEIPFNSKNKWMMKLYRPNETTVNFPINQRSNSVISMTEQKRYGIDLHRQVFKGDESDLVLLKGAPDYLIKKCSRMIDENGDARQITKEDLAALIQLQNDWCSLGQRVLLICKNTIDFTEIENSHMSVAEIEAIVHTKNDFCLVGLVGIIDPPREGIADVVNVCRGAGIRLFMVTGDYALTAAAIALQIGLFTSKTYDTIEQMRQRKRDEDKVNEPRGPRKALLLTGSDMESLADDEWRLITPYEQIVFARTTPEQKLRTVKEFQHDGCVVAVTGDGVNDSPALKQADIGIAMGGGSEVAIEAAQLVLLDNNFVSIVEAIKNGRLVFANLRKVIIYLLPAGCISELIPVLMSFFIGVTQNLSSFQMLILSLFTDIAPSLSLIMEPPEKDLLKQPPRAKNDHLVNWKFLLQGYGIIGGMIVFFSQCFYFWYMQWYVGLNPSQIILAFATGTCDSTSSLNSSLSNTVPCIPTVEQLNTGQTVTFISIILCQFYILSTRTNYYSFFSTAPWNKEARNLYLFGGQAVAIAIMLFVVFVPPIQQLFKTSPPPVQFFFMPLITAFIMFSVDEIRKFFVRRKMFYFHKWSW